MLVYDPHTSHVCKHRKVEPEPLKANWGWIIYSRSISTLLESVRHKIHSFESVHHKIHTPESVWHTIHSPESVWHTIHSPRSVNHKIHSLESIWHKITLPNLYGTKLFSQIYLAQNLLSLICTAHIVIVRCKCSIYPVVYGTKSSFDNISESKLIFVLKCIQYGNLLPSLLSKCNNISPN